MLLKLQMRVQTCGKNRLKKKNLSIEIFKNALFKFKKFFGIAMISSTYLKMK